MKILIDTNVILDVLCDRTDFVESSSKIWKLCEVEKIDGYISALSIPNIVYILRKELTPEKSIQYLKKMGITSLDDKKDNVLSLAIGGMTDGVSPLEMKMRFKWYAHSE